MQTSAILVCISRDLEGSKFICYRAADNTGHLSAQCGWWCLQKRRAEKKKGGEIKYEKRKDGKVAGVHPSSTHTVLGGEMEKTATVVDKRAIQLRTSRT